MNVVFETPDGESKAERKLRKDAGKAAETRPLDPWERYRALSDQVDHMLDVIEMADRRTRFALVVLGTLNAANVLIALQADVVGASALSPALVRFYVGCYLLAQGLRGSAGPDRADSAVRRRPRPARARARRGVAYFSLSSFSRSFSSSSSSLLFVQ
jgi:hypothetical protein